MKKLLILAAILIAFSSCEKTDLTTQIPPLQGSWQWYQSNTRGCFGPFTEDNYPNEKIVFVFEKENKISILYNEETIVSHETYSISEENDPLYAELYGKYIIKLPKKVRELMANYLPITSSMTIDGYIGYNLPSVDKSKYREILIITEIDNKEMEGGLYRESSMFRAID